MKESIVSLSTDVLMKGRSLSLDQDDILKTIITIDGIDFYMTYLNPSKPGNKGSNIIVKLFSAQNYDEEALIACGEISGTNTVQLFHHGVIKIQTKWNRGFRGVPYRFYTMEYADQNLMSFLEIFDLPITERLSIFIEICNSLRIIKDKGYFHRDIKPDST